MSSRTNSRPQLPRYAVSSTLPLEESGEHSYGFEEETEDTEEQRRKSSIGKRTALEEEFAERREALCEEIMAMPPNVKPETIPCVREDGLSRFHEGNAVAATLVGSTGRFVSLLFALL